MRDKDCTDMDSSSDRDRSLGPDSSTESTEDLVRNRDSGSIPEMDEEEDLDEEELQERQRQGNLGNERVRQSER